MGGKISLPSNLKFWTQCPCRINCKSWNLCKNEQAERSDWTYEWVCSSQEEGLCGELILNSWFPQTSSLNYGCSHPWFSIHLWLSIIHWTPVLGRGGIFLALCSSAAQCLLWSGAKDFFPWLLVLQKALCPWSRGWGRGSWHPQIGGGEENLKGVKRIEGCWKISS